MQFRPINREKYPSNYIPKIQLLLAIHHEESLARYKRACICSMCCDFRLKNIWTGREIESFLEGLDKTAQKNIYNLLKRWPKYIAGCLNNKI